jgi:hypothetical protein
MAERGRKPGFVMSDAHRVKIQNSNILNALIEHVDGKREMSATQVSAGLGLLKKVLPDLASVTVEGTGKNGEFVTRVITELVRPPA